MKTIALSFALILATAAEAAPSFINYVSAMAYPATTTTTTLNGVTSGNLIVVAVRLSTTGSSTVTGGGITWTKSVDEVHPVGLSLQIHSGIAVSSGNLPVTITVTGGSTSIRHVILQYSGVASSSYIVAHNSAHSAGAGSGSGNSGNVTATDNNLLFCACCTDSDLQGWNPGSGFTFRDTPNQELEPDQKLAVEDKNVTAGTYAGTTTMKSDSWCCGVVAFAPSGGGGGTAPTINTQPASTTVHVLSNALFTVSAGGSTPLTYQWKLNGSSISGATTSSYATNGVALAANGNQYSVQVDNAYGTANSSSATLTVTNGIGPTITGQPYSTNVTVGANAGFRVISTGDTPHAYQWQLAGVPIAGATSSFYLKSNCQPGDDGGQYRVAVTNLWGATTSSVVTLTVTATPAIWVSVPSIDFGNMTTQTVAKIDVKVANIGNGTLSGLFSTALPFSVSNATYALSANQTQTCSVFFTPSANVKSVGTVTASGGGGATINLTGRGLFMLDISNMPVTAATVEAPFTIVNGVMSQPANTVGNPMTGGLAVFRFFSPTNGSLAFLANVLSPSGANNSLYVAMNGIPVDPDNVCGFDILSPNIVTEGIGQPGNGTNLFPVVAGTNDLYVYGREAQTGLSNIFVYVASPPVDPPIITAQPASVTIYDGQTTSFSVTATGTSLAYQWASNGVPIPGATSSSFSLPAQYQTNSGDVYVCTVTNSGGIVFTAPATVTVKLILTPPSNIRVTQGQDATFTIAASSTLMISYQWYLNDVAVGGATSSSWTKTGVATSDSGQVYCIASTASGSERSASATLAVDPAPPPASFVGSTIGTATFGSNTRF